MLPHQTRAWTELAAAAGAAAPDILALFGAEPDRLATLAFDIEGIHFDFSKQPVSKTVLAMLGALAREANFGLWRRKLAAAETVNLSEGLAATHMALREPQNQGCHDAMFALARRIRAGKMGRIRHILHIGIGGSATGPELLLDALKGEGDPPQVRFVTNLDRQAFDKAVAGFEAAATLVFIVSKSFTTKETLVNGRRARAWLRAHGIGQPEQRMIAITAQPDRATALGFEAILPFAPTVGGRFSLWSAVSSSVVAAIGEDMFAELLAGAHHMDAHFLAAPIERNAPVLAAMIDVWNTCFLNRPTRAIFAYDDRLRLLPSYLQQLEMESNGKGVARDGSPLPFATAPILWGGTGTDAQHSVFQLLHQGTHADPVEFVAALTPPATVPVAEHHLLLANCIAQGAALLHGCSLPDGAPAPECDPALAAAKAHPGNRGSTTILLDRLDARTLGALLAFYEARIFAAGVLMGVNSFDQWGVELGKRLAEQLEKGATAGLDPSTLALLKLANRPR